MADYVWKVNIAWVLFYAFYCLAGSGNTFFRFRRFFFFGIVIIALGYPYVTVFSWMRTTDYSGWLEYMQQWPESVSSAHADETVNISVWTIIYHCGVVALFGRFCCQLWGVVRLRKSGRPENYEGTDIIYCEQLEAPFSFFKWIFIGSSSLKLPSVRNIIWHEKAHIGQLHFVDVLLWEGICIAFWYNPAVWLLRMAVRQNLEFLADRQVLNRGSNRKEYQYLLLRQAAGKAGWPLGNFFNTPELKKRIRMMNQKASSVWSLGRYLLFVPLLGVLLLSGKAQQTAYLPESSGSKVQFGEQPADSLARERKKQVKEKPCIIVNGRKMPVESDLSSLKPEQIKSITILKGKQATDKYGEEAGAGVIEIELKKNE